MRVTNSMLIGNMMANLNRNLSKMAKIQDQTSSGKLVKRPSDDPVYAARSLMLRTNLSRMEQFNRNVDDGISWLTTSEIAVKEIGDVLHRVRDLALKAKNGTLSDEDRESVSYEIESLKDQIVQSANTEFSGRYIFAGHKTREKPFEVIDDSLQYNGDQGAINYNVGADSNIKVNIDGRRLFMLDAGDSSLYNTIDRLDKALKGQDGYDLDGITDDIDRNMENVLEIRAEIGSKINRFELIKTRMDDDTINITSLMSKTEDMDLAEAIMNLKMAESVYRASLAAGARIIQPTLVDFLR